METDEKTKRTRKKGSNGIVSDETSSASETTIRIVAQATYTEEFLSAAISVTTHPDTPQTQPTMSGQIKNKTSGANRKLGWMEEAWCELNDLPRWVRRILFFFFHARKVVVRLPAGNYKLVRLI